MWYSVVKKKLKKLRKLKEVMEDGVFFN